MDTSSAFADGAVRDAAVVYACLTHVPLRMQFPDWVIPICLGQAQVPGRLNLRDLAPEWEPHHPALGSTAGSFALKNYIEKHRPDATRVGICQYRKFVSRERIGAPDNRFRPLDGVSKAKLPPEVFARLLDPGASEFLISRPFSLAQHWKRARRMTYLRQYVTTHHVEDLLRLTAIAVDLGVIQKAEVQSFLEEENLITGGVELGVYPAPFWLRATKSVEAVIRECVRRYPGVRPGVQARSWSFCSERLGSFLLLKEFGALGDHRLRFRHLARVFQPDWVKRVAGQLTVITDTET